MDDRFAVTLAHAAQPPLDTEALERILDLGGASLRTALGEQLIADFQRLRAALVDDDTARLARTAHELKGLAATIGAGTVADMARSLDAAAQGLTLSACTAMVPPLQGQVDRVISVLRSALDGAPQT